MTNSAFNPNKNLASIAVNCVLFGLTNEHLFVNLQKINIDNKQEKYMLPESFVIDDESLEQAIKRTLKSTVGISKIQPKQFFTFEKLNKINNEDLNLLDAKDKLIANRSIVVSYFALIQIDQYKSLQGNWFPFDDLPNIQADHSEIILKAYQYLKNTFKCNQTEYSYLLPKKFTLTALQNLYEVILNKKLDKRNFRKTIINKPFIKTLNALEKGQAHRPARLYSYKKVKI